MPTLKELLPQLPPDIEQEVRDFAEFLIEKRQAQTTGGLTLQWRGTLRRLRDQYSSVELQHRILQSWGK
jgi:hypothetical protein